MDSSKNKRLEYRDFDVYLTEKEEALEDFIFTSCAMAELNWNPDYFRCPCCLAEYNVFGILIHNEIVKH